MAAPAAHATRKPRPGVESWKNPSNGFEILQLHYTADPEKRTAEWKAKTFKGMHPRAIRREYEIDWASPAGEPVTPEYDEATHCAEITPDPSLRLLRFWDFGFDSPVVLFAQLSLWDQLRIYRELCPFNLTLYHLIPAAEAIAKELLGADAFFGNSRDDFTGKEPEEDEDLEQFRFATRPLGADGRPTLPDRRVFDAGDPEAGSRKSLGSESAVMAHHGLTLKTIRPGTKESYANLRRRLLGTVFIPGLGRQPALVIAPQCRVLRQSLQGAFCKSLLPPYKPKRTHPYKDLVDALRYGIDNLDAMRHGADTALRAMASRDIHEPRV